MFTFYIDYDDGTSNLTNGLSRAQAERRYKSYNRRPDLNAKGWGFYETNELLLSQYLRIKKSK